MPIVLIPNNQKNKILDSFEKKDYICTHELMLS